MKHFVAALLFLVLLSSSWGDGVPGVLGQNTNAHNQDNRSSKASDARAEIPLFYTTTAGSNSRFNADLLLQADVWIPGQAKSSPVDSSASKDAKSSNLDPPVPSKISQNQATSPFPDLTMTDFSKVEMNIPSMTPSTSPETPTPSSQPARSNCAPDESQVSVEKVAGVFCVSTKSVCSDSNANGECPGHQPGLLDGSYCTRVGSGVFGCHPGAPLSSTAHGSIKGIGPGGAVGQQSSSNSLPKCGAGTGSTFVSVVGKGTFCAPEPVCSGANFGNCPQEQEGLGKMSWCEILGPAGVYGCI